MDVLHQAPAAQGADAVPDQLAVRDDCLACSKANALWVALVAGGSLLSK